ncbi:HNH endonuclease family protein [Bathymodiolus septemdierum thioautotrophic gill symbiont]|uniref:HNH nuclease domain-containing protein n=1 Tax=endosymbiont of Bathymodiolus septemdierum str. Myojin knoll TaxID=1303921 RepID=A0A0P0UQA4_9GAMM|nr:DUF262 domain-containing protein [Bathymodiolus septemdierum thioautotrophic gill symbiont]BAS67184.1 conserved hypothetical protein [endosymbiont of Bathymodiolus septemdierum str. Myojin knoll]
MKINPQPLPLISISRRQNEINPKPQYQRPEVWSDKKKQLLIDTILRGYDMPKIYLTNSSNNKYKYEVIDGQQRLRAIWGYYNNDYSLGDDSINLPIGNLSGKKHEHLPIDAKDKLDAYVLSVVFIEDASDVEIRDLFSRLQKGMPLNAPENRNAIMGNMRDFIAELTTHKVFQIIPVEDKRYKYADWLAHVVCLELAGGETDIKAKNLKEMYQNNVNFDVESKEAKNIKKILNFIFDAFDEVVPELNVQWGFIDFYLLISLLSREYITNNKKQDFAAFYVGFEQERRSVEDPSELIEQNDTWAKDLYDYIDAFKAGGVRRNIKIRNEVYTHKLFREIMNLETKDAQRAFDANQKIVMWRRDNEKCKQCGCGIEFKDMHADHIIPHSKGGKTTIENGQTLCASCNLKKGNG